MDSEERTTQTPHTWIKDMRENARIEGDYLVTSKTISQTRQGSSFLTLTLGDRTGTVEARVWERAEEVAPHFKEGDIVTIAGQAGTYKNQIQIQIHGLQRNTSPLDPSLFQESTPRDILQMFSELRNLSHRIENRHLRALIEGLLTDHGFISEFKKAPAAKTFHHNYRGGLLEHTLSVAQMAVLVAEHYPDLDGDLLLSGAIVHDIGKMDELTFDLHIDYSDQGRLLGHIVLGVLMVEEKLKALGDFPPELALRLKHLILSHHGELDLGSPKRPKFLEAFALHLIDDLDAKITGLSRFLRDDRQEGPWTAFHNLLQRYLFKGDSPGKADTRGKDLDGKQHGQRHLFPVPDE